MKFLKTPVVAVLLSLAIVISSTLISTNIKLGRRCDKVSDGFYEGVVYDGYEHKSIASHIKNICGAASGLVAVANNYGVDAAPLSSAVDMMKSGLSNGSVSENYVLYYNLLSAFDDVERQLSAASLSERDAGGAEQYALTVKGACKAIDESGYNESVREFYRKQLSFPADILARLAGVDVPQLFE